MAPKGGGGGVKNLGKRGYVIYVQPLSPNFSAPNFTLPEKWSQTYMVTRSCNLRTSVNLVQNYHCGISPLYINYDSQLCYHQKNTQFKAISKTLLKGKYYKYHIDTKYKAWVFSRERVLKRWYIGNLWHSNQIFAQKVNFWGKKVALYSNMPKVVF